MKFSIALLFGVLSASASMPAVRAQLQDLLIVTQYVNVTDGEEPSRCDNGACTAGKGCNENRGLQVTGQCYQFGSDRWLMYMRRPDEGICQELYEDSACTQLVSSICTSEDDTCAPYGPGGFSHSFELYEDYCLESATPQDEFVYPFVNVEAYRFMENCTAGNTPGQNSLIMGGPAHDVCLATVVPLKRNDVQGPGSFTASCDPSNQSHVVHFYSDAVCGSQEDVLQLSYVREVDECIPDVRNDDDSRTFKVQCGVPLVHCKLPTDNQFLTFMEGGSGDGDNSGAVLSEVSYGLIASIVAMGVFFQSTVCSVR